MPPRMALLHRRYLLWRSSRQDPAPGAAPVCRINEFYPQLQMQTDMAKYKEAVNYRVLKGAASHVIAKTCINDI